MAVDLGVSFTDEDRVPPEPDTDSVGAIVGLAYEWKITTTASVTERLIYYPNFDNSDDWRADSTTAVTASLSTRLALQFLKQRRLLEHSARFDVIALTWPRGRRHPTIQHIQHAFEATGRRGMFS